ncbi:hypothetical protein CONPUDRAFT_165970 [Coniophora puteana RWD-64-598 SS2]|uniref:Uncharacterized protein n=1 Tax=Coniophora puteana (strain RWD-64-598) TaxID=741705 RepID=A0A5M3MMX0_CONPW|nr:uncharacterized protein CONPUDRAFT_165970 [Coniophora puteana RWD-64-598 SS2]EIW80453.1 hypothetical protein CONPUDRAFT_165970 [Coniophora puteana RWD-64-598 SS2]
MLSLADNLFTPFWLILPEIVLYGAFAVLLSLDIYIIVTKQRHSESNAARSNIIVLAVGALMFVIATLHVCTSLYHAYLLNYINAVDLIWDSFLDQLSESAQECISRNSSMPQPPYDYQNLLTKSAVSQEIEMVAFVVQLWLGDGFMLFRLWKVWNNDKRVVLPVSAGFLANIAMGIVLLYIDRINIIFESADPIYPGEDKLIRFMGNMTAPTSLSVFAVSFVVHLSCTVLIAARIFYLYRHIRRHLHGSRRTSPMAVAITLLESGAIYSISMFCLLVTYSAESYTYMEWFYYSIVMNAIVPIIGIAFSLIVIRMGLGITTEMHFQTQDTTSREPIARSAGPNPIRTNSIMMFAQGSSANTEDPELKTSF